MITQKLDIDTLFINAVMTKTRLLIVEGHDDLKKFSGILSNSTKKQPIFKPVELIKDYTEGCKGVIDALNDLKANPYHSASKLKKFVLGIIDKDVRNHRLEIPNNDLIYTLIYYSIESYFVNKTSLESILHYILEGEMSIINDELISYIFEESIRCTLDIIYFPVLDALKSARDREYISKAKYDMEPGAIKNHISKLYNETEISILLECAEEFSKNVDVMMDICKGKWLLDIWLDCVKEQVATLPQACSLALISTCDYCTAGIHDKCLYKVKIGLQGTILQSHLFDKIPKSNPEIFTDILERYEKMFEDNPL
ncbi:DUF4435 domain-containing protein [Acinetobacter sp. R933-2]|uniref:DUF4435 domain-containing protein n=1 Tax=Acinetobacter sp. R933-2 TaxID=2746728 RepID=UPI002578B44B|nr:DUF4435 domain-containing protein [Acinetobacter sp. R933-2]MDM1248346.1 DUF4435 domain-containing protein [Acinetobacter sp. R933-2]